MRRITLDPPDSERVRSVAACRGHFNQCVAPSAPGLQSGFVIRLIATVLAALVAHATTGSARAQFLYHFDWSMTDYYVHAHDPNNLYSSYEQNKTWNYETLTNSYFQNWSWPYNCQGFYSGCGYYALESQAMDGLWTGFRQSLTGWQWETPCFSYPFVGPVTSPNADNQIWYGRRGAFRGVCVAPPDPFSSYCAQGKQRTIIEFDSTIERPLDPGQQYENVSIEVSAQVLLSTLGDNAQVFLNSRYDIMNGYYRLDVPSNGAVAHATWSLPGRFDYLYFPLSVSIDGDGYNYSTDVLDLEIQVHADVVCPSLPTVTVEPVGVTRCPGEWVTFSAVADGGNSEYWWYQWYQDGYPVDGATGSEFSLRAPEGSAFSSDVYCLVSNGCASEWSSVSSLDVNTSNCPSLKCDVADWTSVGPPGARLSVASTYDPASQSTLIFGGSTNFSSLFYGDTWSFDGAAWKLRSIYFGDGPTEGATIVNRPTSSTPLMFGGYSASPNSYSKHLYWWNGMAWWGAADLPGPGRVWHSMAYDSFRDRALIFGGQTSGAHLNDLWEWDWGTDLWTQRTWSGAGPGIRRRSAMAYDPIQKTAVLFGGESGGAKFGDTWTWKSQTSEWTLWPNAGGPSAREGCSMTYDPSRSKVVLFGGDDGAFQSDLYEWNGATQQWIPISATGQIPGRSLAAFAYDDARNTLVVYGGQGAPDVPLNDTWEFQNGVWTQRNVVPHSRFSAMAAYDPVRAETLVFGGTTDFSNILGDTWAWNGSVWSFKTNAFPGGPTEGATMAYDTVNQRLFLFGGYGWPSNEYTNASYTWNGTTWVPVTTSGGPPDGRVWHGMAYDSDRGRMMVFGGQRRGVGYMRDFWELDSASGVWTQLSADNNNDYGPSRRKRFAMCYDPVHHLTMLFGGETYQGTNSGETWLWDAQTTMWTLASTTGPSARTGASMSFDPERGSIVLFGGNDGAYENDTWMWDGDARKWTHMAGTIPPGRSLAALVYDSGRKKHVLFGGQGAAGYPLEDTWELHLAGSPTIVSQPADRYSDVTSSTTLAVTATGADSLTYQWRRSGEVMANETGHIEGATTASLTLVNIVPWDAGTYDCVVSDDCGSVTSREAKLMVCPADYNGDSWVSGDDFDAFVYDFEFGLPSADVNHDTFVSGDDFDFFMDHFVSGC